MYQKVLTKVFLPLLPAMAVLLATTGDSVTVFNVPAGTVETYSFFPAQIVSGLQLCTVLAAILAVIAVIFALIFVVSGKSWSVHGVFYTACVSTFASACPVLVRGDVVVVPHVVFPVLMAVVCILAHITRKKSEVKVAEPVRLRDRR